MFRRTAETHTVVRRNISAGHSQNLEKIILMTVDGNRDKGLNIK